MLPAVDRRPGAILIVVAVLASFAHAQVDPATALLERAGWDALRAGRTRAADDAFRQALARDPANARLLVGAATVAVLESRYPDARQALERALEIDPRFFRARALLGQVRYRSGDRAGAIREYEQLVIAVPDDEQARATLERWRREGDLHDRMQQEVGAHFTIAFEGPEEAALASRALEGLERAYWRLGETLFVYPLDPVQVVLYTGEQFRDITRSPPWAAGAFDGTIRIPIRGALANPAELDRVLAHEFVHAVVRSLAPGGVPAWLNEGLATALERDDLSWAEDLVRRSGYGVPLVRSGFGTLAGDDARLAYATSALAARRLLEQDGGFAVANLLRDVGAGEDFDRAFGHRMQRSVADFEASLQAP